ncbi:MAG: IMPACT family protein [Lachnospiraceae bacterium]|nr:IMPACT family protein [Lachnospiraceae bacterium]
MAYCTIRQTGSGEYEEKKSRFLAEAIPVKSEEGIAGEIARIRKTYYDARHHCYAYILGEERMNKKASDDGEPQGTAGLPILKVIDSAECTNVLVVVTRYFGGTLLGTGGLVRSYTNAAKAALEDAQIVRMEEGERFLLTMGYPLYDMVMYALQQAGIKADDTQYTDKVSVQITVPADLVSPVREHMQALGNGTIGMESLGTGFFAFSR